MRSNYSRQSDQSFSISQVEYQLTHMTSKLADKEKRIEEYKDEIAKCNSQFETL